MFQDALLCTFMWDQMLDCGSAVDAIINIQRLCIERLKWPPQLPYKGD